ncbi:hypothetical protein [Streptomyces bikiniensis]|uniref:hypothetical protein n=1 Tax=Streptomyces bikiniensis TaxID=1896 RepID=UPI00142890F0|nr:hypothetical protein [Streptomyces bikiniensis]
MGGSRAGLFAARVLSDHAEDVVVVEPGRPGPDDPVRSSALPGEGDDARFCPDGRPKAPAVGSSPAPRVLTSG